MADLPLIEIDGLDDSDEDVPEPECPRGPNESPLQRLQRFALSEELPIRQYVPTMVEQLFKNEPTETLAPDLPEIMKILAKVPADEADLQEHLPQIANRIVECCAKTPSLKSAVMEYLIALIVRNLGRSSNGVDKGAHSTLIKLIELDFISKMQAEIQVCPSILALSKVECQGDNNTSVISLMCKMAPLLGRDVTERVFLSRFAELCRNDKFYVRRMCASHFGDFCSVVSREAFEKVLLPCYVSLCNDSAWCVRKFCAQVVVFVSCACAPPTRRAVLAPLFIKLLKDDCEWVRRAAYPTLGAFISTFADPAVTRINVSYDKGDLVLTISEGNEFMIHAPVPDFLSDLLMKGFIFQSDTKVWEEENDREEIVDWEEWHVAMDKAEEDNKTDPVVDTKPNEEDIKEIVETVKNAVLSYRTVKVETGVIGGKSSGDPIACDSNNGDKLDSELVGGVNKVIKSEEEDLHLYNSVNYWYISPDLPIDPDLGGGGNRCDANVASNVPRLMVDETCGEALSDALDDTKSVEGVTANGEVEEEQEEEEEEEPKPPLQDVIPQDILEHFISMADPDLLFNKDNEMSFHCAYSLPAVALTLGSRSWDLLKGTVECLAGNMQYKVRRTVASSLHELALILGPEIATNDLMPLFDGFIKDLDEVRIGVLKHLADFLKLIRPDEREAYLPRLQEFLQQSDNEWNWRFREELAKQLLMAVELFRPADTSKFIGVIAQHLLCDKVAAVRQEALMLTAQVVKKVAAVPPLAPNLLVRLSETFAHSTKWKRRQTFALLCAQLLAVDALPMEDFANEVLAHLIDLGWDPVANVRLVVARTIVQYIAPNDYFNSKNGQHYNKLHTVLLKLQKDEDRDVRFCACAPSF